jgi:hypothetical protein
MPLMSLLPILEVTSTATFDAGEPAFVVKSPADELVKIEASVLLIRGFVPVAVASVVRLLVDVCQELLYIQIPAPPR